MNPKLSGRRATGPKVLRLGSLSVCQSLGAEDRAALSPDEVTCVFFQNKSAFYFGTHWPFLFLPGEPGSSSSSSSSGFWLWGPQRPGPWPNWGAPAGGPPPGQLSTLTGLEPRGGASTTSSRSKGLRGTSSTSPRAIISHWVRFSLRTATR